MSNTRHLAGSIGSECLCRGCCGQGSQWKAYVKLATRRSVRRSEKRDIENNETSTGYSDGQTDHVIHITRLQILNVQNMRSIR